MGLGPVVSAAAIEVVLPTYNGAAYLEAQLASIHAQTLRPERVLLRDDGSSDGTQALIHQLQHRYGAWLQVSPADGNLGCTANVNRLLEATTAPYVALADQDDLWLPHKLQQALALMQQLEERNGRLMPLLVHSDLQLADADGRPRSQTYWQRQRLDPARTDLVDLLSTNVVTGCSVLLNRSLLDRALPIPSQALMHDWWLALVASAFGYIDALPQPTVLYRQHSSNVRGSRGLGWSFWQQRLRDWREGLRMLERISDQELALEQRVLSASGTALQSQFPRQRLRQLLTQTPCRRLWTRPWPRKHGPLRTLGLHGLLVLSPRLTNGQ